MYLKRLVRALLPGLAKIPAKCSDQVKSDIARTVVQRFARGNLNLARGRYQTAADLEARKKRLALHSFDEEAA